MIKRVLNALRMCFTAREETPETESLVAQPIQVDVLRDEYEAIPKGPKGVRRKRNSVRDLAARHQMTTTELMAAVRKMQ